MRRKSFCLFFAAILFTGTSACSANPEQRAEAELQHAKTFYEKTELDRAEKIFRHVQKAYAETKPGKEAEAWLAAIERKRGDLERERTLLILGRIREVVEGFRTVYGRYPAALQDFDRNNYIFDSKYLAEVVPAEFTAIVAFDHQSRSYRGWVWKKGETRGYLLDPAVEGFIPFSDPQVMKNLLERGGEPVGNLISIQGDIGEIVNSPT